MHMYDTWEWGSNLCSTVTLQQVSRYFSAMTPKLTSHVLHQQRPSFCCPPSRQCPWLCLRRGCTRTWVCALSGWCPRCEPSQMHLFNWRRKQKRKHVICHLKTHGDIVTVLARVQVRALYLQMQCKIRWERTWQRQLHGRAQCRRLQSPVSVTDRKYETWASSYLNRQITLNWLVDVVYMEPWKGFKMYKYTIVAYHGKIGSELEHTWQYKIVKLDNKQITHVSMKLKKQDGKLH